MIEWNNWKETSKKRLFAVCNKCKTETPIISENNIFDQFGIKQYGCESESCDNIVAVRYHRKIIQPVILEDTIISHINLQSFQAQQNMLWKLAETKEEWAAVAMLCNNAITEHHVFKRISSKDFQSLLLIINNKIAGYIAFNQEDDHNYVLRQMGGGLNPLTQH